MKVFGELQKKLIAVFDVGSASVGGALVCVREGRKPEVLQVVRKDMPFQKKINHDRYFSVMLSTFEEVAEKLEGTEGEEITDEAVCFFSNPWYDARFEQVEIRKDKPFVVTEEVLEEAINEKVAAFEKEQQKKYQNGRFGVPELVEKENMEVCLNGYEVANYDGRKAIAAETSYFASVIPAEVLKTIKERILRRFNERDISFRTFPFSSYVVTRDFLSPLQDSFLFIHITGEMTDLIWVRDGSIKKGASFALGRNFIIRRIAEEMNTDATEAASLFSLYCEGRTEKNTAKKLEKILEKTRQKWVEKTNDQIRNFSRGGVAPQNTFFTSDEDFAWWFRDLLENRVTISSKTKKNEEVKKPVCFVGANVMKEFCVFSKGVKKDAFLGVEAVFLSHSQNI